MKRQQRSLLDSKKGTAYPVTYIQVGTTIVMSTGAVLIMQRKIAALELNDELVCVAFS